MKDIRFYDTGAFIKQGEELFKQNEKFLISSITVQELHDKKLLELLNKYPEKYEIIEHRPGLQNASLYKTNIYIEANKQTSILMDAYWYNNTKRIDEVIFVTGDLDLAQIANQFFGDGMIECI